MLTQDVFHRLRDLAYDHAGISIRGGKESLVEARIACRLRVLGLPDAEAYVRHIEHHLDGDEIVQFLNVISTNFTSFFRESDHFAFLSEQARVWLEQGRTRIRIWCAASSSGEEPYSLAMTLDQVLGDRVDWKILATDISTRVLAQASAGSYRADRLTGVPARLAEHYFPLDAESGARIARPDLRARISFGRLNLARPPYPIHGPLDGVFCRNVMIYFDTATRQQVATEVERLLRPGAFLVIGHAESLAGIRTPLELVRASVLRKPL